MKNAMLEIAAFRKWESAAGMTEIIHQVQVSRMKDCKKWLR